jgi:hypothetical protein
VATGTWHWYGKGLLNVLKGAVDLDTDTFKVLLTTSSYTPDQDTHEFRSDVTNEAAGTGYTAGGATLSGVSLTYDAASNEVRLTWADATWSTATLTARTAVIYKSRGGASSADELVGYVTGDADVTSTAGTWTLDLPSVTLKITVS